MDKVEIVASSNNLYVPYLSVMIRSVMDYSDKSRKYNITVLHTDISSKNKRLLEKMLEENFSISFINVDTSVMTY